MKLFLSDFQFPISPECLITPSTIPSADQTNFYGPRAEERFYIKLRNFFSKHNDKYRNVIIFAGWEDQGISSRKVQREFDFLIISALSRTLIHIEVKGTYSTEYFKTASSQLQKGFLMFSEKFSFPAEKGWKYVKAIYFEKILNPGKMCEDCQKFVFTSDSDIETFLDFHLTKRSELETDSVYLEMIRFLLFVMFQTNEPIITPRDVAKHADKVQEKVFTAEKIIFYSKDQFNILRNGPKKVLMTSYYGTGKTTILKSKIRDMAERYAFNH